MRYLLTAVRICREPPLKPTTREFLARLPLHRVDRIVFGLEGDWSPSSIEVWRRDQGSSMPPDGARSHAEHRPSLELYLGEIWVGIPCFERIGEENVFDERLAQEIIRLVEAE